MSDCSIAFTAPHFASAQVGLDILKKGGTAIEAMVAGAASIATQYPHMSGLGGDGFWLISEPDKAPIAIDACGVSAIKLDAYDNLESIPNRGPLAAVTMAGCVAGWQKALEISHSWQQGLSLNTLFDTAINQANWGIEVTQSLSDASFKTFEDFKQDENFAPFLIKGKALKKGKIVKLKQLSHTLEQLAKNGLSDFYKGALANSMAADLQQAGSPISLQDFHNYEAKIIEPLSYESSFGTLYNLPAPTQGIASLLILALFDQIKHLAKSNADLVHLLIECTKQAFIVRNKYVADPSRVQTPLEDFLKPDALAKMIDKIQIDKAQAWPHVAKPGDTVWMSACDGKGRMVSYIQSLYWEFGSGVVLPSTGIVWNNRGTSFSLDQNDINVLRAKSKPFHTLNPAYAHLSDGRRMCYGSMGGEGQPQTQAAIFVRHIVEKLPIETAIEQGRWLLGRTWGDQSHNLKIESDLEEKIGAALLSKGHDVASVGACNELMGHAGAIVLDTDGNINAASDPRSDGKGLVDQLVLKEES